MCLPVVLVKTPCMLSSVVPLRLPITTEPLLLVVKHMFDVAIAVTAALQVLWQTWPSSQCSPG
jgi:hypothetical protein